MKKTIFPKVIAIALMAQCLTTSCSKDDPVSSAPPVSVAIDIAPPDTSDYATVHFSTFARDIEECTDGFQISHTAFARTRGELVADGKALTDLWILDYIGSTLQQQIHQVNSDDDFGEPTLNLSTGSHHIYFIASRGQSPTLSTANHMLTFGKVLDTFWLDYALNVTATSSGNRSVTLDRIVTKLVLTITDEIPDNAATFNIIPDEWNYGFDYMTGNPTAATASQSIVVNIPASSIGKSGESVNVFGFSTTEEWTTDVVLNCESSDNTTLGTATLTAVPLVRNRITNMSGPLFSSNGTTTVGLAATWSDSYNDTW